MREDKNETSKASDIHSKLKNFCAQKNVDFIGNININKDRLGVKKLQNKPGNDAFSNILKYLNLCFWNDSNNGRYAEEHQSKSLESISLNSAFFYQN